MSLGLGLRTLRPGAWNAEAGAWDAQAWSLGRSSPEPGAAEEQQESPGAAKEQPRRGLKPTRAQESPEAKELVQGSQGSPGAAQKLRSNTFDNS